MPQGTKWQWNSANDSWDHHAGRKSKGKGGAKPAPAGKDGSFPSYDAGSGNGAEGCLGGTFCIQSGRDPERACPVFPTSAWGTTTERPEKAQCKEKLVSKLDRLKKALDRKKDQWSQFRAQMREHREHLAKEHVRFDQEVAEIEAAITTTQTQLDRMLNGEPEEPAMETESNVDDLDKMLEEDQSKPITGNKTKKENDTATMEALRLAQLGQQQMAKQLMELQQQVLYMSAAFRPPNVGSPVLPARGPEQHPFTPVRNTSTVLPQQGPYIKEKAEPKDNAAPEDGKETTAINIEEMAAVELTVDASTSTLPLH